METIKIPFYARVTLIFLGLFAFIDMLYIAQSIIIPILFSIIIAILLSPLVDFMVTKKMNRVIAIALSILLVFVAVALLLAFLSSKLNVFIESFPKLLDKFYELLDSVVVWASRYSSISAKSINLYVEDTKLTMLNSTKSSIGSTITSVGSALIIVFLIPVYIFLILFYQPLLLDFIRKLFGVKKLKEVNEILGSTKTIIQKYLIGLLLEAVIVAILNAVGLLIIGVDYAIVLGIIGALLNVIPYIGGIIAVALPMIVALMTNSSPLSALLVLVLYIVIQFIDNHFIIPKMVASKVKINALVSIIVVLTGGALWGVPGMFLSIPLTAIVKVIFDHVDELKPWGILLGDTMPAITIFKLKKNKD